MTVKTPVAAEKAAVTANIMRRSRDSIIGGAERLRFRTRREFLSGADFGDDVCFDDDADMKTPFQAQR
jgi:hypothetical protein